MAKCSPEEIERLSQLLSDGKLGEVASTDVREMIDDPGSYSRAAGRRQLGWFWWPRVSRHIFGEEFQVKVMDPAIQAFQRASTFEAKAYRRMFDDIAPVMEKGLRGKLSNRILGIPYETNQRLAKALEVTDSSGTYRGPIGGFSPETIEAAGNIRRHYSDLFKAGGLNDDIYINFYRPHILKRPTGLLRDMDEGAVFDTEFINRLTPPDIRFIHELERRPGVVIDFDDTFTAGFHSYVSGLARAKILAPELDRLEREFVNPHFNVRHIKEIGEKPYTLVKGRVGYNAWKEYVSYLLGNPTPVDEMMTDQIRKLTRTFGGREVHPRIAHKMAQTLSSLYYSGAIGSPLGGRPTSILRQFGQLVPTFSELGPKYTAIGLSKALESGAIRTLEDQGLITPYIERLAERVSAARGAGRVLSEVSESFLWLFSSQDRYLRGATGYGAAAKFDDFIKAGRNIRAVGGSPALKDELEKLVASGKIDDARNVYMRQLINDFQYAYGPANRPKLFRGALGQLTGMFMTFPLNAAEMYAGFAKRAGRGVASGLSKGFGEEELADILPMARLLLTTTAVMYAGSEYLNSDLSQVFMIGALPHSLAFPKTAIDTYKVGKTNLEYLWGSLFNVGESDFHKKVRADSSREWRKSMIPFIPGGLFGTELHRTIDEGSLARMFGFTPKGEELNLLAKERRRERQKPGAVVKPITSLRGLQ